MAAARVFSRAGRSTAGCHLISPSPRQELLGNVYGWFLHPATESALQSVANSSIKDFARYKGSFGACCRWLMIEKVPSSQLDKCKGNCYSVPYLQRASAAYYSTQSSEQVPNEAKRKDISTVEDPFDAPTYNIPEKPVTFTEGASYSVVILAGLGIAGLAAYAVFKELIFEPKEYKIFGKALERLQSDNRVTARIGSPVTGYGQESRNRAARQRIPNRVWTDEDGVEHVEVNFHIRGPHGYGEVYTEMFKNNADKKWTFTYLIVDIKSPLHAQLVLESYLPA